MYFQIWNFFLKEEQYLIWKNKINLYKKFDTSTWQKIVNFFACVEQDFFLKTHLGGAESIEKFMYLLLESGYDINAEELAWFLVTRKEIWNLFDLAQTTPALKEQLLLTKNPQQFSKIAADYGYNFSIDELAWLLTEIKSSPELVSINNSVGEILTVSNYGKVEIGYWIWLAEEWGIVPPFCHRVQSPASLHQNVDNPFLPDRCFLPKSYFNQHLVSQLTTDN
ncbi:Nif11-like leader peptide family natural product precursor [Anabaena azotica]|uniref:Nif11 family protein n=1 Tax=Anabaena azotica FACHB-119 TaxID=947527 RepID=A0ABR8D961_9NOST|nr:Nif11-like leader peptide family natural product precursor [Anabaena azotica]MBD2503476.1 Nif11 family protein [Anabaena azotica FACHB-119]